MRKIITLVIILLSLCSGFSQTKDIDSLTIELAFQNPDTLKVDTSLKLIKKLYNAKQFNQALKFIIESEKLAAQLNYSKGMGEAAYFKALIYAQKNDYINAITEYTKAKSIYNELKDLLGVAKVDNSIGAIEIKRENYSKGIDFILSAVGELEKRERTEELNMAYSNLALAYLQTNAIEKSIEFNLKALQVQIRLNDYSGTIKSNSNLANLYSIKREHRKAIEYYEIVLANSGQGNDSLRANIYPKLGGEYLQFNNYETAASYLLRGLQLNRETGNKPNLLITLNNLGELNFKLNKFLLAEEQLLEAAEIAKTIDKKHELLRNYRLMTSLDSTRGRFDRAFEWQRAYYDLKNELDSRKRTALTVSRNSNQILEPGFNDGLTSENNSTQNTDESGKIEDKYNGLQIIFYVLLGGFAIIIAFLILSYSKRHNSMKYVQELEEKNAKMQVQNEAYLEQTKHLENVNSVKDKLFSIISHDLKDSLSSINGFIDLLKDGSLSRDEFNKLVPELSQNANNASLLLFNLLNWSKSQMQSLDPNPTLFDIQEVFEDKVKLIEQRADSKGINLIDHSLRDFAYADRSMFEIVVQNLLANAVKFCKAGDTITISNHISNGSCIVSIKDTGVGISKENQDKLFKSNSFTTAGTKNEKGTGLGLSICKELVELNHGKIWVESTLGVGSTFYVQLPKSKPA